MSKPVDLKETFIGAGCSLFAALSFACTDVLVKVTNDSLSIWQIALGRCLFGLAVLLSLSRIRGFSILGRSRLTLFLSGASGAATFILIGLGVRMLPISQALLLLYLFPAFAALLSPWLTGDRISGRTWLWIGMSFLGMAVLLWPSDVGAGLGWGHLVALCSGLAIALSMVLLRRLGPGESPFTAHIYYCFIGALAGLAPLLFGEGPILPPNPGSWIWLLGIAVFALAANLAMNKSVHYISAPQSGVILMAEVVTGSVLGVALFGEEMGPRFFAGALLVLGGGVLLTLRPGRTAPPDGD